MEIAKAVRDVTPAIRVNILQELISLKMIKARRMKQVKFPPPHLRISRGIPINLTTNLHRLHSPIVTRMIRLNKTTANNLRAVTGLTGIPRIIQTRNLNKDSLHRISTGLKE